MRGDFRDLLKDRIPSYDSNNWGKLRKVKLTLPCAPTHIETGEPQNTMRYHTKLCSHSRGCITSHLRRETIWLLQNEDEDVANAGKTSILCKTMLIYIWSSCNYIVDWDVLRSKLGIIFVHAMCRHYEYKRLMSLTPKTGRYLFYMTTIT